MVEDLYGTVWCGMVWYGMVRYSMVWNGMVTYDTALLPRYAGNLPSMTETEAPIAEITSVRKKVGALTKGILTFTMIIFTIST